MSNLHPIFEDIVNAFTGRPASVSGHIVAAAAAEAPDHGSPDRNMVAAENLSAAGAFPETKPPVLRPADCCPRCGGAMDEAAPHPGERDTNIPAFAGGHECTDCGLEVEEEDTFDDHDRARASRGEGF